MKATPAFPDGGAGVAASGGPPSPLAAENSLQTAHNKSVKRESIPQLLRATIPPNQVMADEPSSLGFSLLPADRNLPAVQAGFTSASEVNHPANTILRRHIRGERDGLSVAANLLCGAYLSLLRVWRILFVRHPQRSLCLRICSALQRLVGHSLAITSHFSI
jgi:hypothetical protein